MGLSLILFDRTAFLSQPQKWHAQPAHFFPRPFSIFHTENYHFGTRFAAAYSHGDFIDRTGKIP